MITEKQLKVRIDDLETALKLIEKGVITCAKGRQIGMAREIEFLKEILK